MCRKRSRVISEYNTHSDPGGRWNRRDGPKVTSTGYFAGDPGLIPSTPRAAQKPSLTTVPEIQCPCGSHGHCMHSVHLDASKMLIHINLIKFWKNVRRYWRDGSAAECLCPAVRIEFLFHHSYKKLAFPQTQAILGPGNPMPFSVL